jgi:hypothetical protein
MRLSNSALWSFCGGQQGKRFPLGVRAFEVPAGKSSAAEFQGLRVEVSDQKVTRRISSRPSWSVTRARHWFPIVNIRPPSRCGRAGGHHI